MSDDDISNESVEKEKKPSVEEPPKKDKVLDPPKYEVRPGLQERFQVGRVREIIDQTMQENLLGRTYTSSQAEKWVQTIAKTVRERVNMLEFKRYKIIVQVQLSEQRGSGIKSGMRCLWDTECDNYATHNYYSDTLFCNTTVYGIYYY